MTAHFILFIDDEDSILETLSFNLEKRGYQVDTAQNGESGVQKFKATEPDVVITDILMGGMSGIEVLKQIKKRKPDTIVIVLTGYGNMDSSLEALRLGAYDYLQKPCDREELAIKVSQGLHKQVLERQVKTLNSQLIAANNELINREKNSKPKTLNWKIFPFWMD